MHSTGILLLSEAILSIPYSLYNPGTILWHPSTTVAILTQSWIYLGAILGNSRARVVQFLYGGRNGPMCLREPGGRSIIARCLPNQKGLEVVYGTLPRHDNLPNPNQSFPNQSFPKRRGPTQRFILNERRYFAMHRWESNAAPYSCRLYRAMPQPPAEAWPPAWHSVLCIFFITTSPRGWEWGSTELHNLMASQL